MRMRFNDLVRSESTEGSGGSSAPAAEVSNSGVSAEIKSIMDFDPFDPGSDAASSAGVETGQESSVPPPEVPAPPVVETPPAPPPPPEVPHADMAAAAQAMREAADALKTAAPPPPAAPDEYAPQGDDGQPINYHQINLPDALLAAMNSENPAERKQATTHLIASSMATAHRMAVAQAMRMMNAQVAQVLPNFVQEQITQHQQRQEIFQDFYGKFPDLSAPPIRNVIVDQAKQLQQQMGNPGWTPAFRDALGQHVRNMLRGYVSPTGTQAPPAPPPVPSGVMTPPSARSAQIGTPQAQNPWDDLM